MNLRTYLTQGLSVLLKGAAQRLEGTGGDPVVGYKLILVEVKLTLCALYMVGGTKFQDLPILEQLMEGIEISNKVNKQL